MRRSVGLLPSSEVATGVAAIGGSDLQAVVVVGVAGGAGDVGMSIGEQETRRAVIEFCIEKGVEGVATLAICRGEFRAGARMIGIGSILPIFQMTGIALRGEAEELADRRALVAGIALHGHVSAQQREAVVMIFYSFGSEVPRLDGVALRAVGAHLAAVNVGVTIGAIFADVGEHGFHVALHAVHFFVLATQGIVRFVVIEFRYGADGAPVCRGVAIFARDGE